MKTNHIILIAILVFSGCRSLKEKKQTHYQDMQAQWEIHTDQSAYAWQWLDSTGRYWYYQSDSAFYFHPDSGLHGRGGAFLLQESMLDRITQQRSRDSALVHVRQDGVSLESRAYKAVRTYGYWFLVVGVVVLLAAAYMWGRR